MKNMLLINSSLNGEQGNSTILAKELLSTLTAKSDVDIVEVGQLWYSSIEGGPSPQSNIEFYRSMNVLLTEDSNKSFKRKINSWSSLRDFPLVTFIWQFKGK
jgi:hypothetical protein